ncbi:LOW QUALITY PROTEIN: uncharacterized protein LOC110228572 [Arabidopsis lyrata subsp. lyrata]|uniref:LOW QUALITY PROTEIN: uncharacterized protein LOC110228572 n=1 Tax=Arabidopsis lyrata subsp. lyrata TaxID=81972 RepID=UPI000A29DBBC|nr:LOW QUALITY PROTEIN: uncharacterized protein LOC110228572 [Arabidopsis lyrata subsp. lyrata]|eukprot:XP_020881919.1 LOW QUALITY PROTEIN: uncharacterized protein LOC110228572 [Arabidopsis lyrata subsp. lyrata]
MSVLIAEPYHLLYIPKLPLLLMIPLPLRLDGAVTHIVYFFLCLDRGRQSCRLLYYTPATFSFFPLFFSCNIRLFFPLQILFLFHTVECELITQCTTDRFLSRTHKSYGYTHTRTRSQP